MEEKQRSPLLLRIRASIASLRSTSYATHYNLLPPTTFRNGRGLRTILFPPHFVRRKWGYIGFILLVLLIVIVRLQFAKRSLVPFEETPAVTGHTKGSQKQTRPPIFSTFTDNYPKQLAILIFTSSSISLNTFSVSIIDTWGKIAKQDKSLSVDLWFVTPEDTLKKFGWPNIPYDDEEANKFGLEQNNDDDIIEGGNKEMLRETIREIMMFKNSAELSNEQKEFQKLTKAFHYLYENHLDHYNYILKITDKTFVRLPKLLELLSILNNTESSFLNMKQPKLIGRPNLGHGTTKKFCHKGSGYIINKNLLATIGPHLPFCLATMIKDSNKNDLQEDLAIEKCFIQYVPTFKGCETFVDGNNGEDNDFKNLHGHEFLYLRPDDEINWEKYKEPLEVINDGYITGWRFADAVIMGEVKDPSNMIRLEEWYGKGGKFDELVKEMGGVIPEPTSVPIQEENHDEDEGVNNKEMVEEELKNVDSVVVSTETPNENMDKVEADVTTMTETPSEDLMLPTISEKLPVEDLENEIDKIDIITIIPTSTLEETVLQTNQQISTITPGEYSDEDTDGSKEIIPNIDDINDGNYDDNLEDNHNSDELSLIGEELAEP